MMNRLRVYFLSVSLFCLTQPAIAGNGTSQAEYWLNKMSVAVNNLSYDGHFVYLHNNMLESLRTVHSVEQGRTTERLFSMNGEAREIVRDSHSVTSILPKQKKLSTARRPLDSSTFSSFFRLEPERIDHNYHVRFLGKNRVADRTVNVIEFQPEDRLRYGYRLFLDDEYSLPLQWEMFDVDNQLVSSIMFTNINIEEPAVTSPSATSSPAKTELHKKVRLRSTADARSTWQFDNIPSGYQIHHQNRSMHHDQRREVEHLIFSDGLASFSVYIEASDKIKLKGPAKLGALNAYGVFIDGYQLTAVGEVPIETLIFIGDARKP